MLRRRWKNVVIINNISPWELAIGKISSYEREDTYTNNIPTWIDLLLWSVVKWKECPGVSNWKKTERRSVILRVRRRWNCSNWIIKEFVSMSIDFSSVHALNCRETSYLERAHNICKNKSHFAANSLWWIKQWASVFVSDLHD